MLEARALSVGHAGRPALVEAASFSLARGQALVLLGPNGSGKTTLLRCLLGLMDPMAGHVFLDGADAHRMAPAQRARRMAYVPQAASPAFPFEVFDMVLMGRSVHLRFMADPTRADLDAALQALECLGIDHLARRRFDALSGGERQLTLLARALAQAAPVVVLDEPCASLDPGHQVEVLSALRALKREGRAVLMSTHLPEHALALDAHALLLHPRRLVGPALAARLLQSQMLTDLYATPIETATLADGRAAGRRVFVPLQLHAEQGVCRARDEPQNP